MTTVFSGIQPTGVPHLGNYLGALREWVKLQNVAAKDTKLMFSIVDLHALTVPQERCQLRKWRKEAFATLVAVGLDPNRATIFYQSAVCPSPRSLTSAHYILGVRLISSSGPSSCRIILDFEYRGFYGLSISNDAMEGKFSPHGYCHWQSSLLDGTIEGKHIIRTL
jgi:hypothetical protein